MVETQSKQNEDLLKYQGRRLQDLIREVVQCCEDRKLYEHKSFGVPHAELKCLRLFDGSRYLTVKDIAYKLEVAKSRVTKIIKGLIEKGMVQQIDDPKDARIKLIRLTAAGEEKSKEIRDFHDEIHRDILLEIDAEERKQVITKLDTLRSAMEAVKSKLVVTKPSTSGGVTCPQK